MTSANLTKYYNTMDSIDSILLEQDALRLLQACRKLAVTAQELAQDTTACKPCGLPQKVTISNQEIKDKSKARVGIVPTKAKNIPCASTYCKPVPKKVQSNEELTQAQSKQLQKLLVKAEQSFSTFEKPTFSKDYKDLTLYPSEIERLYQKADKEFLPFMSKITALYKRKGATGRQAKRLAQEAWHSVHKVALPQKPITRHKA